jgi:hypothetical protein
METRRIRRLQQRRVRRLAVVMSSIGALGLGVGLALPRSVTASVFLLAVALASLVTIGVRVGARAPRHSMTQVVRLPTAAAVSATVDSFRSRIIGTARAIRDRVQPQPAAESHDHDETTDESVRRVDLRTTPETAMSPH